MPAAREAGSDTSQALSAALDALAGAVLDERSELRNISVATRGLDDAPRLRIVVMRAFDPAGPRLRFYTDRRAAKVDELAREPRCSLLAWDPVARVQLRLEGRATLHFDDRLADEAWAGSRASSLIAYGIEPPPGLPIAESGAYTLPAQGTGAGRVNFCAVEVSVRRLERLHLAREGHRCAMFDFSGNGKVERSRWIVP